MYIFWRARLLFRPSFRVYSPNVKQNHYLYLLQRANVTRRVGDGTNTATHPVTISPLLSLRTSRSHSTVATTTNERVSFSHNFTDVLFQASPRCGGSERRGSGVTAPGHPSGYVTAEIRCTSAPRTGAAFPTARLKFAHHTAFSQQRPGDGCRYSLVKVGTQHSLPGARPCSPAGDPRLLRVRLGVGGAVALRRRLAGLWAAEARRGARRTLSSPRLRPA